jgi:hypothetical protein
VLRLVVIKSTSFRCLQEIWILQVNLLLVCYEASQLQLHILHFISSLHLWCNTVDRLVAHLEQQGIINISSHLLVFIFKGFNLLHQFFVLLFLCYRLFTRVRNLLYHLEQ